MRQDIRKYTKRELALIIYNEPFWYHMRNSPHLYEIIDEAYIYTKKQKEHLNEVLLEEIEENKQTYNIKELLRRNK